MQTFYVHYCQPNMIYES